MASARCRHDPDVLASVSRSYVTVLLPRRPTARLHAAADLNIVSSAGQRLVRPRPLPEPSHAHVEP